RVSGIGDVEQRHLRAPRLASSEDVLPNAEEEVVPDRVEVRGVARDFQHPEQARVRWVGQVDGVQRVNLAERHDVADLADEPDRVNLFVLPQATELADLREPSGTLGERRDKTFGG